MVSETEKIRRHLDHIEKLLKKLDQEDLRPLLMWQILACGPIHPDSIPPFLIYFALEMDRHDRKFAFRTKGRPPNYADERILTVAARIMLWDYIENHDDHSPITNKPSVSAQITTWRIAITPSPCDPSADTTW